MLTHGFLVENIVDWARNDGWFGKGYEYVSFVPPAWMPEQLVGIAGCLSVGLYVNFPQEPETVQEDLRTIGPQLMFYGVR